MTRISLRQFLLIRAYHQRIARLPPCCIIQQDGSIQIIEVQNILDPNQRTVRVLATETLSGKGLWRTTTVLTSVW